jgi:uncharacterized protein (DUF2225 family)
MAPFWREYKKYYLPLLVDHVFREAERLLFIIDMLESSLAKKPAKLVWYDPYMRKKAGYSKIRVPAPFYKV